MPKVRAELGDIYYEVHGEGPPLLLVSGLNGTLSYWKPLLPHFTKHFKVILHDHRGTGQSTRSLVSSVDQMANDALVVMDAAGAKRALYLGHSTGGAIGQTIAIDHPERLLGLVLSASWPRSDPFFRRVLEVRKDLLKLPTPGPYIKASAFFMYPDWWINGNAERLEQNDARAAQAFPDPQIMASRIDAILAFDRLGQLHRINTPTLVICAKDDFLTPAYFSNDLAARIAGAKLHLLEKGGHGAAVTAPDEFLAPVLSFLLALSDRT